MVRPQNLQCTTPLGDDWGAMMKLYLTLLFIVLPATAFAQEVVGAEASIADPKLLGVVAMVVAIAGAVSRLVTKLSPLHSFLPAQWQWLPDAVLGAVGALAVGLPLATDWLSFSEVCLGAVVLFVLALSKGLHLTTDAAPAEEPKQE